MKPTTFALFFGNRGFFPESLIAEARKEITQKLDQLQISSLYLPEDATRYGAVETIAEGRIFAEFLRKNRNQYDGVLLVLPNFGDESGAAEALKDCGVPIYILAYPDEMDKMDFSLRRDAFCGKLSIMDVFGQYRLPFTAWTPHTLHPKSAEFAEHMRDFAAVCRIVGGMKRFTLGGIGARPTAFKTIRFDEVAMQKYGITTEVWDNSDLLLKINKVDIHSAAARTKAEKFTNYTDFSLVPPEKFATLVQFSVALDQMIDENQLNALGLRCWMDLEQTLGISPCVVLSELNDRNFPAACELDLCNAIAMYALTLAGGQPATCLDWNNNYQDDADKCILFHCGPVPQSLMQAKGQVIDHPMFAKTLGSGCSFGCNIGRIKAMDFTFASFMTHDGKLKYYSGQGCFTGDKLPDEYFGCGGVAQIGGLQNKLRNMGYAGYRHHVGVAPGHYQRAVDEAFTRYLHYEKSEI